MHAETETFNFAETKTQGIQTHLTWTQQHMCAMEEYMRGLQIFMHTKSRWICLATFAFSSILKGRILHDRKVLFTQVVRQNLVFPGHNINFHSHPVGGVRITPRHPPLLKSSWRPPLTPPTPIPYPYPNPLSLAPPDHTNVTKFTVFPKPFTKFNLGNFSQYIV